MVSGSQQTCRCNISRCFVVCHSSIRESNFKRSCFHFGKADDKGDCLLVCSQQTQPPHKQYYLSSQTVGNEGQICKSREWQTFDAHLFKYFRLEECKISLSLQVFCLNTSHFYQSHFIFLSSVCFLPNLPTPY
jgi:hypothetical protein